MVLQCTCILVGVKTRALYILDMHSTTEPYPHPWDDFSKDNTLLLLYPSVAAQTDPGTKRKETETECGSRGSGTIGNHLDH